MAYTLINCQNGVENVIASFEKKTEVIQAFKDRNPGLFDKNWMNPNPAGDVTTYDIIFDPEEHFINPLRP